MAAKLFKYPYRTLCLWDYKPSVIRDIPDTGLFPYSPPSENFLVRHIHRIHMAKLLTKHSDCGGPFTKSFLKALVDKQCVECKNLIPTTAIFGNAIVISKYGDCALLCYKCRAADRFLDVETAEKLSKATDFLIAVDQRNELINTETIAGELLYLIHAFPLSPSYFDLLLCLRNTRGFSNTVGLFRGFGMWKCADTYPELHNNELRYVAFEEGSPVPEGWRGPNCGECATALRSTGDCYHCGLSTRFQWFVRDNPANDSHLLLRHHGNSFQRKPRDLNDW